DPFHGSLERALEDPCLAFVGPVVGVEPVGLLEMGDGVVGMAGAVEVLPQLEVGRRLGLLPPTATRTGDDLVGRQREAAVGSFVRPVTQGSDVPLGLDAD